MIFDDVTNYIMFIGYPRSGHSLVGAILNAHENVVISHELNSLEFVIDGISKNQLFKQILQKDYEFVNSGFEWSGYNYYIGNQWQGKFKILTHIGDKKGGWSTILLTRYPDLLKKLSDIVEIPIRILHVIRNPYDVITTHKIKAEITLEQSIDFFFDLCHTNMKIIDLTPQDLIYSFKVEDLIHSPKLMITNLCNFLNLNYTDDYIDDCSKIIFKKEKKSREELFWPYSWILEVEKRIEKYNFLQGYKY